MWPLLLALPALAVSPGGFRLGAALPVRAVDVRQVVALQPGQGWVSATVPRARWSGSGWSLDAELPVIASGGPGFSAAGLGLLRLGGWRHFAGRKDANHALGLEVAFPAPRPLWVTSWGSLGREALPAWDLLVVYESTSVPDAPTTVRVGLGWHSGVYEGGTYSAFRPTAEVALVHLQPIRGPVSVGLEAEAVIDPAPLNGRCYARFDLGDVALDVGVQAPFSPIFALQAIAQARAFF